MICLINDICSRTPGVFASRRRFVCQMCAGSGGLLGISVGSGRTVGDLSVRVPQGFPST